METTRKIKPISSYQSEVRVPPQDTETEQAVLGGMMISRPAIQLVMPILKPEDFYRESHGKIYTAIVNLEMRKEPADVLTLTHELKRMGEFENVGGLATLASLVDRVPTAANSESYALIVQQKAYARERIALLQEAVAAYYAEDLPNPKMITEQLLAEIMKKETTLKDFVDPYDLSRRNIDKMMKGEVRRYIPTGFPKFDAALGGIRMSHLGVITGPGQQRKSTFMSNIIVNIAKQKMKVSHLILEDDLENVQARQICIVGDLNFQSFTSDDSVVMHEGTKLEGYNKWAKLGVRLGDKFHTGKVWAQVKMILMREITKYGTQVIFIEGAEHFEVIPKWGESIHDARARMVGEMDDLAQEYQVPIWCIVGKGKSEESTKAVGTNAWFTIPRQNLHIRLNKDDSRIAEIKVTKTNDKEQSEQVIQYEIGANFRMKEI